MTLAARLDRESVTWRPNPGDRLIGRVVELDTASSAYGDYPLVVVESDEDNTEYAIHAFRTVLKSELAKRKPKVGDRLAIRYDGKLPGKSYEGYKVAVEYAEPERAAEPDWDRMSMEAAAERGGGVDESDSNGEAPWPSDPPPDDAWTS
jgi:hypothetical protein